MTKANRQARRHGGSLPSWHLGNATTLREQLAIRERRMRELGMTPAPATTALAAREQPPAPTETRSKPRARGAVRPAARRTTTASRDGPSGDDPHQPEGTMIPLVRVLPFLTHS